MMFAANRLIALLIAIFIAAGCFGQKADLTRYSERFAYSSPYRFQEKLFVHIDQSSYLTGEAIWLKVYLVDRRSNQLSGLSKVAYIELVDKNNEVVYKTKIAVSHGLGNGSIFLPTTLASGNYNMVAYTRWMRNFPQDFYFHQTVRVVNPFVNLGHSVPAEGPLYDIQFFPEGGNLIGGLKSLVGFRVAGKNGRGIKFKGAIINSKNDTVAVFSPHKFGLGQFYFTPESGQSYKTVVVDSSGLTIQTPLPPVLNDGYVVHVTDNNDFLELDIISRQDQAGRSTRVYLVVPSKEAKIDIRTIDMTDGHASLRVGKNGMREGVNKFILFDHQLAAVCERSYFIAPRKDWKVRIQTDKMSYTTRAKIDLGITPADGISPLRSMSVSIYRVDSLTLADPADITSFLLLTSELKGNVESPGYYVQHAQDHSAIDNLMLTHGWSKFKLTTNVSDAVEFIPEYGGQLLSGRVINSDGNPAGGINTFLSVAGKNGRVYTSKSGDDGVINFDVHDFFGEKKIVLQTNPKIDSGYRIELKSSYAETPGEFAVPAFELSKVLSGTLAARSLSMQLQYAFSPQTPLPPNAGPLFYGKPDERYFLDDFTRFPTMEEVMREYVKGVMVRKRKDEFHFLTLDRANNSLFTQNPLVLLDGVPVFNVNKIMALDPRKIQKLDVIARQYYLGHLTFNGVVSYFTYDGSLGDYVPEKANVFFDEGLQASREFFSPVYETQQQVESRTPDRRHLLLWAPEVRANTQGEFKLSCFSSDVTGSFKVIVEGLTDDGQPVVGKTEFTVDGHEHN